MAGDAIRQIQFSINGKSYTVGTEVHPTTSLLVFLREQASLPGTKACCYEGGCGVCTVVATTNDPETGKPKSFSVNSCQTLVYSCAGWAIETIEHLGNRFKGYHTLQKVLTNFYGTQCGYCSPGMVMTMYGEFKSTGSLTTQKVEKSLDGNLCRCTGYRPILDAFKSLAIDAPSNLASKVLDIEDLNRSICSKTGEKCTGKCSDHPPSQKCKETKKLEEMIKLVSDFELKIDEIQWYRPISLKGIYKILQKTTETDKVHLVVGNTGQGVYKEDGPFNVYIDTTGVKELYTVGVKEPITMGANVSINRCIEVFRHIAEINPSYRHLKELANHWEIVANNGVRNVGSWAGNLMLKHKHPEFPSDIFLTLAVADAVIKIGHAADSSSSNVSVEELMKTDMSKKFILSVTFPPQDEKTTILTYKITPRAVNAHAYVNAAFKFSLDDRDGYKVISKPSLIFGGINPEFVHAFETETFLTNRRLSVGDTIQNAAAKLATEITPDSNPEDASPKYRKELCQALFYKAILNLLGDSVGPEFRSGGLIIQRPISSGSQTFDPNKDTWPIGQAIPKLESGVQISGEAEYVDDMDPITGELHGAFVQSTVANATIESVDPSAALKYPGVVAYIDSKDITGVNSFVDAAGRFPDPVFTASDIQYAGQSIGLIVAERRDIALKAVKLVEVKYKNIKKPILTIKEALKEFVDEVDPSDPFAGEPNVVEGELEQGSQFHFTMEPLTSRVIPVEDGYDVYVTTQWPTESQQTVARVLGIPFNSINLSVRRLGGAYGGKISRQNIVACAAAVAAQKLRKSVRITLDLTTHMTLAGWREPYLSKYKVSFDNLGHLIKAEVSLIGDGGFISNEVTPGYAYRWLPNVYYCDNWGFKSKSVNTNTAANTYCRTPGSVEAIATVENIIERIAHYLKKDPVEIREINFLTEDKKSKHGFGPKGENLIQTKIFPMLKEVAMYNARRTEIDLFNKENRWRKRGLTMIPLFYGLNYPPSFTYNTQVMIYAGDGTVVISHGGIEMGQGINTKVVQVAAKTLNVPLNYIKVKSTNVFTGANSVVTGGSYGSDLNAHGVKICCEKIRERMDAVEKTMEKPTWLQLVSRCNAVGVDICERFWTAGKTHPKGYDIFAAVCMEVEVDVLTGHFVMHRTDIIEDCGRSLSPYVDIGQVEGAFIMGLGYYTSEIVKFNSETGQKISNGTWNYKVPTALDIPTDLRITLLPNSDNQFGVARSKATGEPALCMSYCVVTALRDAIKSAREDAGDTEWFDMPTPLTVERIQQLCKVDPSQFILNSNKDLQNIEADFHIIEDQERLQVEESSCAVN